MRSDSHFHLVLGLPYTININLPWGDLQISTIEHNNVWQVCFSPRIKGSGKELCPHILSNFCPLSNYCLRSGNNLSFTASILSSVYFVTTSCLHIPSFVLFWASFFWYPIPEFFLPCSWYNSESTSCRIKRTKGGLKKNLIIFWLATQSTLLDKPWTILGRPKCMVRPHFVQT